MPPGLLHTIPRLNNDQYFLDNGLMDKYLVKIKLVYLVVALAAATIGFGLYQMWNPAPIAKPATLPPQSSATGSVDPVGQARPEFILPDLENKPVSIRQWEGKVILLNFWATWCPPCREEIPAFMEVLKHYGNRGFEIVGIAVDDREAVLEFTKQLGVDYPQLIGDQNAVEIAERYGNRYGALPYSVLIDRQGIIRFSKPGEFPREQLEAQLESLL